MEQKKKSKEMTITVNRDMIVNVILAIQLGLLIVFGWQLMQIKKAMGPDTGSNRDRAANVQAPTQPNAPTPSQQAPTVGTVSAPTNEDHVRGSENAVISLIEYSDYECPFCARFHPTAQQAVDEYDGQVNWIFRHFPLSFHAGAQKKAEASNCVAKLGGNDAFWTFTDTLLASIETPVSELVQLAVSAGVDGDDFQACLDSGEEAAAVQADLASGQAAGVTGTPGTIVYNNETGESELVPGALPYAQLQSVIDSLL